ncbi:unnamed protein product, partial [Pneumocystis jirovecii]
MSKEQKEVYKEKKEKTLFFLEKNDVSGAKYEAKQDDKNLNNSERGRKKNGKEKESELGKNDETKSHSLSNDVENEQNTTYHSADGVLQEKESESNTSIGDLSIETILEKHSDMSNSTTLTNKSEEEYPIHNENVYPLAADNFIQKQKIHVHREPLEPLSTHETDTLPFIQSLNFNTTNPPDVFINSYVSTKLSSEAQEAHQQPLSIHEPAMTSTNILQEKFEEIYQHASSDKTIDWEFFRLIISDYNFVVKAHKEEFSSVISTGIPSILRGILWQTITSSKNSDMERIYHTLINQPAPAEKNIQRDLYKTFSKATLKAKNTYIVKMSEEEAFCIFIKLMKDYDLRSFYIPNTPGLHLRLYQFNKLMEEIVPTVYIHLHKHGIEPSMYASQWFMTLFAYKFPINMVVRVFDVIIAEGTEAILKFSIALMKKNQEKILSLKFDQLLSFLKEKMFLVYSIHNKTITKLAWSTTITDYQVDEFINDAYSIEITESMLSKYAIEYKKMKETEIEKDKEIAFLKSENSSLFHKIKSLEESLDILNKEHIKLANSMVESKIHIACLLDENEGLTSEVSQLKLTIESQPIEIEERMKSEMQSIMDKNIQ